MASRLGHVVTLETRKKIGAANAIKMKEFWVNNPKHHSYISAMLTGRTQTEESHRKRSASLQRFWKDPQMRLRHSLMAKRHGFGQWMNGRTLPDVVKIKISASAKGYVKSAIHRKRLSESHKGMKLSLSHRAALSQAQKRMGTIPPSQRHRVPWNYRGATKLHFALRKLFEYQQWRNSVFVRDRFKCVDCEAVGKIHAHHIKRFSVILIEYCITTIQQALECQELWDVNNGISVCHKCHRLRHRKQEFSTSFIGVS